MKRILLLAILLAALLLSFVPAPVSAIADPVTPPDINFAYVYRNLLEDGDVGVLVEYYIDYAVLPTETATESYLVIFVDTDGTTQLRSVAPYAFGSNGRKGYRDGLAWIYFSAADATLYSLNAASVALYSVWVTGNPTVPSGWPGVPPKTIAGLDGWQADTAVAAVVLAQDVRLYAAQFGTSWSLDMLQETSVGHRLTATYGEPYFQSVIPNLRAMAPSAFANVTLNPTRETVDYSTAFGATAYSGSAAPPTGATVAGSPDVLSEGSDTVTVTALGTTGRFTVVLAKGTVGTITAGTGTMVEPSPSNLVAGTNTLTATGIGTFTVVANRVDTETQLTGTVTSTAFDLTTLAQRFGMSRLMFSGLVWLLITILICAATYKVGEQEGFASGKTVMLVFDICIIGGALLGLLHPLVAGLLFVGFVTFTGYVLFYRGASI